MDLQPPEALSDEALAAAAREDSEQFGTLIDRYQAKLARYINRLGVRNPDDQQDVLQEVFIKVYKNLNAFDSRLAFSSWIYRIAHNEAVSWFRKQNVRPEGHLAVEGDVIVGLVASSEDSSEVQFDRRVNATEVARALEQLEARYRDVLILRFFEHKEYEEISDILKIPVGSVGTLLHRGKKRLHTVLHNDSLRV